MFFSTHAELIDEKGNFIISPKTLDIMQNYFQGFSPKYSDELMAEINKVPRGKGYPNHLWGDGISFVGHLVRVADVLDALLSKRQYKPAFPEEKVRAIFQSSLDGIGEFHPLVADIAMTYLPEIIRIHSRHHSDQPGE